MYFHTEDQVFYGEQRIEREDSELFFVTLTHADLASICKWQFGSAVQEDQVLAKSVPLGEYAKERVLRHLNGDCVVDNSKIPLTLTQEIIVYTQQPVPVLDVEDFFLDSEDVWSEVNFVPPSSVMSGASYQCTTNRKSIGIDVCGVVYEKQNLVSVIYVSFNEEYTSVNAELINILLSKAFVVAKDRIDANINLIQ